MIAAHGDIPVVALAVVPDDAKIGSVGGMGTPIVGIEPISTEVPRFGLRVAVLGLPAAPAVVGPAAFGYDDVSYRPLTEWIAPGSGDHRPVE